MRLAMLKQGSEIYNIVCHVEFVRAQDRDYNRTQ